MNRDETKKLFAYIGTLYPNFTKDLTSEKVDIWTDVLSDFEYSDIVFSLREYVRTNTTGFAPVPGQLIAPIVERRLKEVAPDEGDAWSLVLDAIGDALYHSAARFKGLPPLIQQAVGSAYVLTTWAQMESEELEVVHSNFARSYRSLKEQAARTNASTGKLPEPKPAIEQRMDVSHLLEEKREGIPDEKREELLRWYDDLKKKYGGGQDGEYKNV